MAATLSAKLVGRFPQGLVADIVRSVIDDTRQSNQDPTFESANLEARRRLDRFIRASSRQMKQARP